MTRTAEWSSGEMHGFGHEAGVLLSCLWSLSLGFTSASLKL